MIRVLAIAALLGFAVQLPVSVGRTNAESDVRVEIDDMLAQMDTRALGIHGDLERCQEAHLDFRQILQPRHCHYNKQQNPCRLGRRHARQCGDLSQKKHEWRRQLEPGQKAELDFRQYLVPFGGCGFGHGDLCRLDGVFTQRQRDSL